MKILVTGAAGFIGSRVANFYAGKGYDVVAIDNLSRDKLLGKEIRNKYFNWNYLKTLKNVTAIEGDVRDIETAKSACSGCDYVLHAAAQTAVTTSIKDPATDFYSNAVGTFNVLEASRLKDVKKFLYCSTNKVYGNNVNNVGIIESEKRYEFEDEFKHGIPEDFSIDICEHTPYGSSKLAGTHQFGLEDQGWVAWFAIANILNRPITIYGDGKQVRDVLYIQDLINLYDKFIGSNIKHGVFNAGGGPNNTLSLLELLDILHDITGKKAEFSKSDWRPSDQKVYISDIRKAKKNLGWEPKVSPKDGLKSLVEFVKKNREIF